MVEGGLGKFDGVEAQQVEAGQSSRLDWQAEILRLLWWDVARGGCAALIKAPQALAPRLWRGLVVPCGCANRREASAVTG